MTHKVTMLLHPDRLATEADRKTLHDFMDGHGLTRVELRTDSAMVPTVPGQLASPARFLPTE